MSGSSLAGRDRSEDAVAVCSAGATELARVDPPDSDRLARSLPATTVQPLRTPSSRLDPIRVQSSLRMRTMGLDVGTRTVGVAISDALGLTAQPIETVRRKSLRVDLEALGQLAREHEVHRVIVGLPLNMDGTEGPRALASRKFAETLGQALGLPVELWDERLTTAEAQRVLLAADVSRARRKEVVDTLAASIILQGWLDSRSATRHDGGDT